MRILLGMSGGTDSSTAAILLKEQGYTVVGITYIFKHVAITEGQIEKARNTAQRLGIEHHVSDRSEIFQSTVISHFVDGYLRGTTPSPCVYCNPNAKFKFLLEDANRLGCEKISTGHYIQHSDINGVNYVKRGVDPAKDQSYFLWNLPQEVLKRLINPLGAFTKTKVRELAVAAGYASVSKHKESMGICFIENGDYTSFIADNVPDAVKQMQTGDVFNKEGDRIGTHNGVAYYTIGQKKNLQLDCEENLSVIKINADDNTIIVGKREDLNTKNLKVAGTIFNNIEDISSYKIQTFVRGLGLNPEGFSKLTVDGDVVNVELESPAWAIAPGQPVVFYIDDIVIGGGFAL